MRHICPHCKQTSIDGNLWCQDIECPAGKLPSLLNYGDTLGPLHIARQVRVLRAAVIYEATMDGESYLLKIANPGDEDYLKQEAIALSSLKTANSPYLPVLCAHGAENIAEPHGEIVYQGKKLCYMLFKKVSGDFLYDYLLNNPQPWHKHVGWFMIGLSGAVRLIHRAGGLHLNLNPENILVWQNRAGIPQPLLLDIGVLTQPGQRWGSAYRRYEKLLSPAYLAPEIVRGETVTEQTDVYLLGLIMYEMLNGQPAIDAKLRKNSDVRSQIQDARFLPFNRSDLQAVKATDSTSADVAKMARSASAKELSNRYATVDDFYNALGGVYGAIPNRAAAWYRLNSRQLLIAVMALVIIALVITLMVVLASINTPTIA